MTVAELQAEQFEPLNAHGSTLVLFAPDAQATSLGVVESFRVLSAEPDGSFWITWRSLWFWEAPQFTHIKRMISVKRANDTLLMQDSDGNRYAADFFYNDPDEQLWTAFQRAIQDETTEFKRIDVTQRASVDAMFEQLRAEAV